MCKSEVLQLKQGADQLLLRTAEEVYALELQIQNAIEPVNPVTFSIQCSPNPLQTQSTIQLNLDQTRISDALMTPQTSTIATITKRRLSKTSPCF